MLRVGTRRHARGRWAAASARVSNTVCGGDRRWHDGRHCGCSCRRIAEFGDRFQQLLAMAERRDANLIEIVAGQPAQQLPIDVVGAERLGIMGKTDRAEQIT